MSASGTTTPTATEAPVLDDRDMEPRTPMKRLGSTRKLAAFNNIRVQLSEQTRVLEARAEAAAGVAGELHDYCRRRADLEHEYSRALDKLARAAAQRHKDQKHKREQWPLTGAYACWQAALENTRSLSRDHAALADLYGGPLAARLQRAADDVLRLHRKCRDIVAERHEEVGAALAEAAAGGKAHAAAAADWRAAALKLRHAHHARAALLQADPPRQKKIKALDKELEKRRTRHSEARAKALRARADYVLSLEAANATLQRYYLDDIADIMLCTEVGFEAVVGRAVRTAGAAEGARAAAALAAAGGGGALVGALRDRQADDDHVLHTVFAFRQMLAHAAAADCLVNTTEAPAYLIDLMQDKNVEIRKMCDSCLDIISQMPNEWAARIKLERFRCHNGQWLSVVETLGEGGGAGDAADDLPPYLSAEYLTSHRLTTSDSQISLNDDSDSLSGEVDFNRANSRNTQDGQSDELLGLSDSLSGKTLDDDAQFSKNMNVFA